MTYREPDWRALAEQRDERIEELEKQLATARALLESETLWKLYQETYRRNLELDKALRLATARLDGFTKDFEQLSEECDLLYRNQIKAERRRMENE